FGHAGLGSVLRISALKGCGRGSPGRRWRRHPDHSRPPPPLRYTPRMPEARLEVTDALGRRVVPLAKAPLEIGRRETNDLRLAGSEVSRDHAEITIDPSGTFILKDRASR